MKLFRWLFGKKRYHNCFTYPCVIVSHSGKILDKNNEFQSVFDINGHEKLSNIINIVHEENRIITKHFNNTWELNYFHISQNEYHVVFFPYSNDNFLTNIPAPLAIINKKGDIIHFNKEFKKYFEFSQKDQNLIKLFDFNSNVLQNISTFQKLKINKNKSIIAKYKPTKCSMWTLLIEDKSDIEQIKEKLNKSHHLQSLGQLIANISHDFNNMFTATSGFCEILIEKTKNSEVYDEVQEIMKHIESARDLSKQLISFVSNNNSENCIAYNTLFNLNRIVQKLVGDNIEVIFDLQKNNEYIELSNTNLERIIINLVINSKDSIVNDGKIKITLKEKQTNKQKYIEISVSDNGCGISKENQKKVFEAFFSTKKEGTGLGLSNISEIMNKAHGKLILDSNENGTLISLIFPAIKSPKKKEKIIHKATTVTKSILIVEDEAGVRKIMSYALEKEGHTVIEAQNGIIALEKLKENPNISLVITDASLPELSGNKLCLQLNSLFPNIKILVVSGYNEETIQKNFEKYDKFLAKPFSTSQLISIVNEII